MLTHHLLSDSYVKKQKHSQTLEKNYLWEWAELKVSYQLQDNMQVKLVKH